MSVKCEQKFELILKHFKSSFYLYILIIIRKFETLILFLFRIENEWIEKSKLVEKKQVNISELFKNKEAIFNNPFFNRHRYRANRRK